MTSYFTAPKEHKHMPSEAVRAWIYRVLTAAVPIVTAYGIVNEQQASLWLGLAGAVLGTGLAALNTSTSPYG